MNRIKVRNYTDKQLLAKVKSLSNFTVIPKGYWILGVRSNEDTSDVFDDKFYLFLGDKFILATSGTTNPGKPDLVDGWKKVNKKGAFILKENYWHHGIWKYGLHKGKLPALVQTGNVVLGYRDGNNNDKSEEIGSEVTGWFGINFHFNSYRIINDKLWSNLKGVVSWFIGGWSYGCQVCNNADDYKRIVDLCKDQSSVTYCLINEF